MTIRVHGAIIQGVNEVAEYEGRVMANLYSVSVLVHSERMICDNKLIEAHFTFYNENGDFVAGRFFQTSYSHDPLSGIHTHTFQSTSEIDVPGNFQFLQRITNYSRDGTGWATT